MSSPLLELDIVNDNARARLNAMQREWGAAFLGFFPGAPLYSEVAGWNLLVELGWRGRQYHSAAIRAVMAEERAWATDWDTLHEVLGESREVAGGPAALTAPTPPSSAAHSLLRLGAGGADRPRRVGRGVAQGDLVQQRDTHARCSCPPCPAPA